MDARADRTALRLKLYDNGFSPLANKNKMSLVKGWSTIEITPAVIAGWEGRKAIERKYQDTGLRCGEVVALDFDIDDGDLLNAFLDELVEEGIVPESDFVRVGRPPREIWLYRTSGRIGKRTTGHFAPPGAEDDSGYAVEVLGRGCQFAAFGQRDEDTAYTWPAESPLHHGYMDLPEITFEQSEAVIKRAAEFFERNGLERRSPGGGSTEGYGHVYDLTPDMVFDIKDQGEMSVEEIHDMLVLNPDEVLRAKADAFRPTSGSWACMVSLVNGEVCVSDHGTYTTHFLESADAKIGMAKLGQMLTEREGRKQSERQRTPPDPELARLPFNPKADLDANLRIALDRYVYVERDNLAADLTSPKFTMTLEHFRTLMAKFYKEEAGPQGGRKITRLADLWVQHADRRDVHTVGMRPDRPFPLFYEEDGSVHLNTYKTVTFPPGGSAALGLDFLKRLLPVDSERRYFMQWLAYKVRHPESRGPGIIMVAHDNYGTGRGTLFEIIKRMFADGLVSKVSFDTLAGKTYQSQYNEWLVDSLMVVVDEAQETTMSVSRWQARNNAYEKLKEIVEPRPGGVQVNRKGLKNYMATSHATIIVATNHADSVVLPINDRRFFICENGQPQTQEYWNAINAWMDVPANVGAFVEELHRVDLEGYSPFSAPPMTASKADMVDAGSSELDRLMDDVMGKLADTLLCKEQVILKLEDLAADSSAELPDDWQRIAERMFLRQTRKLPVYDRVRIEGKLRQVRVRGKVPQDIFNATQTMLDEVLRNGPVVRPVRSVTNVVSFPGLDRKPA